MAKVAIIIPTMNRPDYILRTFRFHELLESPHALYIQDSSNEENAGKIKDIITRFKTLDITYQWVPPGKDYVYQILPLIKEKYCFHMGDDDLIIPKTISECADFLEDHPDYGTCSGQQVNIRFRKEEYDKTYGIIERQTIPINKSFEEENMILRIKNFWSSTTPFICFAVRRIETEKTIRNITKHFGLLEDLYEFILLTVLVLSGKYKVLDKLGYVMQISDIRSFDHRFTENLFLFPEASEKWKIYLEGLSGVLEKKGISEKESTTVAKAMFVLFLGQLYFPALSFKKTYPTSVGHKKLTSIRQNLFKKLRYFASDSLFIRSIYYKFNPPEYVTRPESKCYNDFKVVKDFLEKDLN